MRVIMPEITEVKASHTGCITPLVTQLVTAEWAEPVCKLMAAAVMYMMTPLI